MRIFHLFLVGLLSSPITHAEWYEEMQIGPAWSNSFADTYAGEERCAATKGLLIDLGDGHRALFDTETLQMVTAYEGGVTWGGTPWTGAHGQLVKLNNADTARFNNARGPGWADPDGSFDDPREQVTYALYTHDRKRSEAKGAFGNVAHLKFNGYFRHGARVILDYSVNGTRILEYPAMIDGKFVRHFQVDAHDAPLVTRLCDDADPRFTASDGASISKGDSALVLTLSPSSETQRITLVHGGAPQAPISLDSAIEGGPGLWDGASTTTAETRPAGESPWVADTLPLPTENPWKSNLRFGGFDFLDADKAVLSTWNGDVWVVSGLKDFKQLTWKRYAAGLFEPLGVKVVDGAILVNGRDGITRLHDLNQDGEADHFEAFNRDVFVSPNFHEFAFDLQTDAEGNLYYSKAAPVKPGGRGFDVILPHHGTVVKVSPDGSSSEVIATGLRAPGGLGVGPNGEITTGENEGTWQPCCKINFVTPDQLPVFFGTEPSRHSLEGAPYTEPLCYLPMDVDNSGGSQVWVPEGADWGLQTGELIHLSYGTSTLYRVLTDPGSGTRQGGVVPIPVKLRSSAMRARFHPDGSLYVLGFRGWQTNAATECAFHRIRRTDEAVTIPDRFEVTPTGIRLRFEVALDEELATDPYSFSVQRWDYIRGPQYGSGEFSVDEPDTAARELALQKESKGSRERDEVEVTEARLLDDGRTVEIDLEGHKPSMQLKVAWDLETEEGDILESALHATVREIPD